MDMDQKMKVINGEHKGKVGFPVGMFWASNTVLIKLDNGDEIAVRIDEVVPFKE